MGAAGWTISLTNILIHTPILHDFSDKYCPDWIVSTCSHGEHHRVLHGHYAAPTLNVDFFWAWFRGQPYGRGKQGGKQGEWGSGEKLGEVFEKEKREFEEEDRRLSEKN